MSEFNINDIGDDMLKERLKEQASELGISENDLIDRLILEGLERFDGENSFSSKNLSPDEIRIILMKDKLKDAFNGIEYNQGSIQSLLDIINNIDSNYK